MKIVLTPKVTVNCPAFQLQVTVKKCFGVNETKSEF